MRLFKGCYTALVTPMDKDGKIHTKGLKKLVDFQVKQGVSGILAVGTTGESATLKWKEHNRVIEKIFDRADGRCTVIGGTGSNSTREAMNATAHVYSHGIRNFLLVDPYYNGPGSLWIAMLYIAPIAEAFPDAQIIPYVIPGRTGTQLLPEDLAKLHHKYNNVNAVKEATVNLENMKLTRRLCGPDFFILSGDDGLTRKIMKDPEIKGSGVVSVMSNVAPKAVQDMADAVLNEKYEKANALEKALEPLFGIVTVKTYEDDGYGPRLVKARNPTSIKTLMNLLGMPAGPCRPPLGKMTRQGLEVVVSAVKTVYENNPEILKPVEDFFGIDLEKRLYEEKYWNGLTYGN